MGNEVSFVSLTKEQFNDLKDPATNTVPDTANNMRFKSFIPTRDALETIEDPEIGDVYIVINDGKEENREFFVFNGSAWVPMPSFESEE